MRTARLMACLAFLLAGIPFTFAQQQPEVNQPAENVVENMIVGQAGGNTLIRLTLRSGLPDVPASFTITNPARVVMDLPGVGNGLGYANKTLNEGSLRSLNIIQTEDRSRLVLNLAKNLKFETKIEGKDLLVTLLEEQGASPLLAAETQQFAKPVREAASLIRNIQFRRSKDGAGIVVVDLPSSDTAVDISQKGTKLSIVFMKTQAPDDLRKRLDVTDFGTPVSVVDTRSQGEHVSMEIIPTGLWEHIAYQSDNQFVVEVRPVKEDPNKLFQGTKKGYQGETISLNFQNIPLRELLHVFADITNFNIVVSDSVGGNVSLRLNDVPWDQALEIVLQQKNLAMRKSGSVIWIAPQDELVARDEQTMKARETAVAAEQPRLELFQLNYVKAEDLQAMLTKENEGQQGNEKTASTFLSAIGKITADKRTNQVFIYDVPSKLEMVGSLLKQIDKPVRQVLIEARIVEADTNFTKNLGVRIGTHDHQGLNVGHKIGGNKGFRFGLSGSSQDAYAHLPELGRYPATAIITDVDADTGEITYTREVPTPTIADSQLINLGVANPAGQFALTLMNAAKTQLLTLELSALEADGKGKTISSPRIMTMDQMEATILQGIRVPYLVSSASGATSVAWQDANLSLNVKPHITPDGKVMMKLKITKNALGPQVSSFLGYSIKTKEVISDVLVENGGTVVIGGIYEQEELDSTTRVPFLGDLPYVGFLFKKRERKDNRIELLVMISPKILDNALSMK